MAKVLIFGCGPAGLMAAHAAALCGEEIIILSKNRMSHMRGAQYLHAPIPIVSEGDPFRVTYSLRGSAEAYREKIYGPDFRGTVSPEDLSEAHDAWDIRVAYFALWEIYKGSVVDADLSHTDTIQEALLWAKADYVISTVPADLLCTQPGSHAFAFEKIWSNDLEVMHMDDNSVICNGEKAPAWYRAAKIQGHTTVEWPNWSRPPMEVHSVIKPLSTTCDCFPQIHRMGRYGKWQKGVLSHTAFAETVALLMNNRQLGLF